MESTIVKNIQHILEKESSKYKDDSKIKEYEKAIENYKKLIEKGLTKHRGYNLITIDKAHLKRHSFNVKC